MVQQQQGDDDDERNMFSGASSNIVVGAYPSYNKTTAKKKSKVRKDEEGFVLKRSIIGDEIDFESKFAREQLEIKRILKERAKTMSNLRKGPSHKLSSRYRNKEAKVKILVDVSQSGGGHGKLSINSHENAPALVKKQTMKERLAQAFRTMVEDT